MIKSAEGWYPPLTQPPQMSSCGSGFASGGDQRSIKAPFSSAEAPSPHCSASVSSRQEEPRFISQIHLLLLPAWWRDTSGRGTAESSSRQDVPTGTAGTGGGHPALASHVLRLTQTKTRFLMLPGIFTVILPAFTTGTQTLFSVVAAAEAMYRGASGSQQPEETFSPHQSCS